MPKKGNRKRLKFKAEDVCSESVTVADYANADPAIVKSGRVKKAVVNAIEKEVLPPMTRKPIELSHLEGHLNSLMGYMHA
ncbi:transmembrane protein 183A [Pimephales promelas]|nr:transmembrane protein 183A [Pimephales promelas]